jgi:hypothetical protein
MMKRKLEVSRVGGNWVIADGNSGKLMTAFGTWEEFDHKRTSFFSTEQDCDMVIIGYEQARHDLARMVGVPTTEVLL